MAAAHRLDLREVAGLGHHEPDGGRHRLEDDRGDVTAGAGLLDGRGVVERHVHELARRTGGPEGRSGPLVPGRQGQAGVPVVPPGRRDDAAAARGPPSALEGHVDGLAAAAAEHGVPHAGGEVDQAGGQQGAFDAGEVVVADVEPVQGEPQLLDQRGMPVAEVEGAAVEVEVEELPPVDVPDPVALAPPDHQVRTQPDERPDPVGAHVLLREPQHLLACWHACAIVHRPSSLDADDHHQTPPAHSGGRVHGP